MAIEFASSQPFTVGVEEELFLVDAETLELASTAEQLLPRLAAAGHGAGHEAYACEIELRSPPSTSVAGAIAALGELRSSARAAGATLIGAGLHPGARFGEVELVASERYHKVGAEMRGLIGRTPECALHVHVGMPDAETAIRVHNGLRRWLPLLVALSAGSPFWFGRDSGLASARRATIGAYPGRGIPEPLADLVAYEGRLAEVARGGGPSDYTMLWWDVRLHPRLGTIEVREMDCQARLSDAAALAALVRGLARHEAEAGGGTVSREALEWSMFRAMRDGTEATILDQDRLEPVPAVARRAIRLAASGAREGGDEDALAALEQLLSDPGPARQRRAFAEGGVSAVLRLLENETARPGLR